MPSSHIERDASGFTLIELLVVVAVIGILAAIAIPQYAVIRQRGYDAAAVSDLRNCASAEEAYYAVNAIYVSCSGTPCGTGALSAIKISSGVAVDMVAAAESFTGSSRHAKGSQDFLWDSTIGGLRK